MTRWGNANTAALEPLQVDRAFKVQPNGMWLNSRADAFIVEQLRVQGLPAFIALRKFTSCTAKAVVCTAEPSLLAEARA